MRALCMCMLAILVVSGCTTKKTVDLMIDTKLDPQVNYLQGKLNAQSTALIQAVEDMKSFSDRLGNATDSSIKDLQDDIDTINASIKAVKADLASTDKDVVAADEEIKALDKSIDALSGKVDVLNSTLVSVQAGVKSAAEKAEAANAAVARLAAPAPAQ